MMTTTSRRRSSAGSPPAGSVRARLRVVALSPASARSASAFLTEPAVSSRGSATRASDASARNGSPPTTQRPSRAMPIGTTTWPFCSSAAITDAAEARETSCSPERPPNTTPTRSFLTPPSRGRLARRRDERARDEAEEAQRVRQPERPGEVGEHEQQHVDEAGEEPVGHARRLPERLEEARQHRAEAPDQPQQGRERERGEEEEHEDHEDRVGAVHLGGEHLRAARLRGDRLEGLLDLAPREQTEVGEDEERADADQKPLRTREIDPHALLPRLPALRPPAPPVGEPAAVFGLEAAVGRLVVLPAAERFGEVVLVPSRVGRVVGVLVALAVS